MLNYGLSHHWLELARVPSSYNELLWSEHQRRGSLPNIRVETEESPVDIVPVGDSGLASAFNCNSGVPNIFVLALPHRPPWRMKLINCRVSQPFCNSSGLMGRYTVCITA
jgi:hypothetical protein